MFYGTRPLPGNDQKRMPFSLRAIGYVQLPYGYKEKNQSRHKNYCGVFWAESGNAKFEIAGRPYTLNGGEAVYYYPFESHQIIVGKAGFKYCWFTFDGTAAREILSAYALPQEPFSAGPPPVELFRKAQENFQNFSAEARFNDAVFALRLLENLAGNHLQDTETEPEPQLVSCFRDLVDNYYQNVDFNVESAAEKLNCNRSTLSRLFTRHIGISPSHYIENVRLNEAIRLLNNKPYTAAEIAALCGFGTPEYFSRRLRKYTGLPPGKFRKSSMV